MKKFLVITFLFISSYYAKAQDNYIVTEKDEKIAIKGDNIEIDAQSVSFYNGKKFKAYAAVDLKLMVFSNRLWIRLPFKDEGTLRLMEVICFNDEYILTKFTQSQNAFYMFVFTWDKKHAQPRKTLHRNKEKQPINIQEDIKPFFKDCKELLS